MKKTESKPMWIKLIDKCLVRILDLLSLLHRLTFAFAIPQWQIELAAIFFTDTYSSRKSFSTHNFGKFLSFKKVMPKLTLAIISYCK